jgi:hypothetical protein
MLCVFGLIYNIISFLSTKTEFYSPKCWIKNSRHTREIKNYGGAPETQRERTEGADKKVINETKCSSLGLNPKTAAVGKFAADARRDGGENHGWTRINTDGLTEEENRRCRW